MPKRRPDQAARPPKRSKVPKRTCCVKSTRCARCPIRMLKEGTLPAGLTVKKRRLVKLGPSAQRAGLAVASVGRADSLHKQARKQLKPLSKKQLKKHLRRLDRTSLPTAA